MSTISKPLHGLVLLFCLFTTHACIFAIPSAHDHGEVKSPGSDIKESNEHTSKEHTCGQNEHVQDHVCVDCPPGFTNTAGDDALGENTMCVQDTCSLGLGDACADAHVKIPDSDMMELKEHTPKEHTCGQNKHVQDHVCVDCPLGFTNTAGDKVSGANTTCDDACASALGVSCADFEQAYIKASNADKGDRFGSSISLYKNTLVVGATRQDGAAKLQNYTIASRVGVVYVFTRKEDSTWEQQDYIKGSSSSFGSSISLYEDTLVIGAPYESSNTTNRSGAVYVFTRQQDSTWTQQDHIKASNPDPSDNFGDSVSLYGDTLVASAPFESSDAKGINKGQDNNSAPHSGAVYVFTRQEDASWVQQAYIKASNSDKDDKFGSSISLHKNTLVVGATGESSDAHGINKDQGNNNALKSGAVYVFTRHEKSMWAQQAYIKASNTDKDDLFGVSVSLYEDTFVVSATREDSDATGTNQNEHNTPISKNSGAVYVFTRQENSMWAQQAYIKASNSGAGDLFGSSISLYEDTLIVGAYRDSSDAKGINKDQHNDTAQSSGAVYMFTRQEDARWKQQAYIKASNTNTYDWFGRSVSLHEDTLIIGAPFEGSDAKGINKDQHNNLLEKSGAVYVRKIKP